MRQKIFGLILALLSLSPTAARAEEGMWTLDNPPAEQLQKSYDFTPTEEWLDHLRLSSVRFMDGGSGSFVSAHGLVVTNHHVAAGQLQKMSSAQRNFMETGFSASELKDEIKCPDLEVNVLVSSKDVTGQVLGAVKKGMKPAAAVKARNAKRASLEKACMDAARIKCQVVSLYQGGQYWLYRYRKYTDVRLVFAPERQAAFFGGDWDNFTYPRYDLDVAFFRVYAKGAPLKSEHFLRWKADGVDQGELVFITGHPGGTSRLTSMRELEYERQVYYPIYLDFIARVLKGLEEYAKQGREQKRRSLIYQFGFANGQKALSGMYRALLDTKLMAERKRQEEELQRKVEAEPETKLRYGDAWEQIQRVMDAHTERSKHIFCRMMMSRSRLMAKAMGLVKYVEQIRLPDAERADGFHDSELESLRFNLLSPAPLYPDLEAVLLAESMVQALKNLPADDAWAKALKKLGDPKKAAAELCAATELTNPAFRKKLMDGGVEAVSASDDPLLILARKLAPLELADEEWAKKEVMSVLTPAREKIAKARFAIYGTKVYPDATFTLRMTYGTVRGYPMNGTLAPHQTTLYGLYDRNLGFAGKGDWALPQRFFARRRFLDLSTQVNYVCDCDIIGGNSGSPVVNRQGELVGVVFDGNIESLSNRFLFDAEHSRGVVVSSQYVLHALQKLYDAADLADEILKN